MSEMIKLEHFRPEHNDWFVMQWCLGNTCTYSCSYCPPGLHNGSIKWPDIEKVKSLVTKIKNHYTTKKLYFEFTGGEVTVYPEFIELCKFCKDNDVKVGLISNGSRTERWWEENVELFDHVCLSFHPEEADPEHFINIAKILHDKTRLHVNIMMMPDRFDYCFNVANRVKDVGNMSMALQPLIVDFGDTLFNYTKEQHDIMSNQYSLITKHIKHTKEFKHYRGSMKVTYDNGETKQVASYSFINNKTNNWSGWDCYSGLEQLIVDMSGLIYIGWCKIGGPIGHVNDASINFPTKPVTCTKTMCHCNYDIMSTKINVGNRKMIPILPTHS